MEAGLRIVQLRAGLRLGRHTDFGMAEQLVVTQSHGYFACEMRIKEKSQVIAHAQFD